MTHLTAPMRESLVATRTTLCPWLPGRLVFSAALYMPIGMDVSRVLSSDGAGASR